MNPEERKKFIKKTEAQKELIEEYKKNHPKLRFVLYGGNICTSKGAGSTPVIFNPADEMDTTPQIDATVNQQPPAPGTVISTATPQPGPPISSTTSISLSTSTSNVLVLSDCPNFQFYKTSTSTFFVPHFSTLCLSCRQPAYLHHDSALKSVFKYKK